MIGEKGFGQQTNKFAIQELKIILSDKFEVDIASGEVIGSYLDDNIQRKGVDVEGVLSVDHHALRIQPLLIPGWGRSALAYGPYNAAPGLLFCSVILNGHNTSEIGSLGQSLLRRVGRWAKGSNIYSLPERIGRFIQVGDKRQILHQIRRWYYLNRHNGNKNNQDTHENLAVGWFVSEKDPGNAGNGAAFRMHATGPNNGELWVQVNGQYVPVLESVQNVPLYLAVLQHGDVATYYGASIPGVRDLPVFPKMAPLGSTLLPDNSQMYAGLHQCVLGQIGFRVDTRVYQNDIFELPAYGEWYGTACFADRLTGDGNLGLSPAKFGGTWEVRDGKISRTELGLEFGSGRSRAIITLPEPGGLFRFLLYPSQGTDPVEFLFRVQDDRNYWSLLIDKEVVALRICQAGQISAISRADATIYQNEKACEFQILDNGQKMQFILNGGPVFHKLTCDDRFQAAKVCGFAANGTTCYQPGNFQVHPREIQLLPENLLSMDWMTEGDEVVLQDSFEEIPGDLDRRPISTGNVYWKKMWGAGRIEVLPSGSAKVDASPSQPNPGRTMYALPWESSEFADLEVEITPPGNERGQGENGRSGLAFWESADRFLLVNLWLDDVYEGASISSFFNLSGFEELYDAVWTNVGSRVYWGRPFIMRVVFDGLRYKAYVDGELVIYRSLRDIYPDAEAISIKEVGILANWEWGEDTGSRFRNFVARRY